MPLTFTELDTLLTPTEGSLQITAGQLGAGPVADLLANWFTSGVLSVATAQATADPGAGTVTVTGTVAAGTFLGIGQATLTSGVFTLAGDGSLAARLAIAVGDAGWGLSAGFPVLAHTVCDSFSYAGPAFTLDSTDTQPLPAEVRTELGFPADDPGAGQLLPGLAFTASVTPASSLASKITNLIATPMELTGPIRVYSSPAASASGSGTAPAQYPEFLLAPAAGTAPPPVVVDNQDFTVTAQLACLLTATASNGTSAGGGTAAPVTVNPLLALQVAWTGTGSLPPITLRGTLTGAAADTLVFDTGAAPLTPIGTAELPALLAGTDVSGLLTPGHDFPVFAGLVLHGVSLTLGLGPPSLHEIAALLALGAATGEADPVWPVLGGLLSIHQLVFDIDVARGSDGALHPTAAVNGSATMGQTPAITLTAVISLPGLTLTAKLDETAPADLTALLKDQLGITLPLPTITSADVTVTGDVAAASWTVDTQVNETWAVLGTPPGGVSLQDIALHLAGASGQPVTGSLTAGLELGGVPLAADADYSTTDGWTVYAGLATGAQADLAAVLTTLLAAAGLSVTAPLPSVTLATLSVGYQERKQELSVAAAFSDTGATLLQQLGQDMGLPALPAIGLSAIDGSLTETTSGTAITLNLTATDWQIPLGPATLVVSGVALGITHTPAGQTASAGATAAGGTVSSAEGAAPAAGPNPAAVATTGTGDTAPAPASTTATITGTLALAGVSATVNATLPGALTITGSFPAVGLGGLIAALSGNTLTLPSALTAITLPASTLELTEDAGDFQLTWQTAASPLGQMVLQVQRQPQAGWGVVAGFALPAGWKLSSLSSALSGLDGLSFDSAGLVLSSFADPSFAFSGLSLPAFSNGVVEGLTFGSALELSGALAGAGSMLGKSSVDVTAVIGADPSTIKLTAALAGTVAIPPTTNLLLGDLALTITPDPLGVSLSGALTIPVGSQTLVATGRFSVTETAADFALDVTGSALSLAAPMGFRGVVLDEIGVVAGITFEPPGLNLGLAGAFHLGTEPAGSDRFAFAFTVEGEAVTPTLLSGHLDQLDLPTLFGACMLPTAVLPSVLNQVSFSNLTIYWCDTEQPLPDGSTAQPGFGLSGSMLAFGWNAAVNLLMNFGSGVHGEASCDPVNLASGAFTLTGTGTTGGPHMLVDTTASPYLSVSLNAKLLDIIGENVQGTLSSSGLTFSLANHLGVLDAELAITASPSGGSLASGVNFALDVMAGPLNISGTNLTLGTIHVQAAFSGSITINISAAGFHATIDGGFIWQGQHWQLATVTVTETPADVAHIGEAIAQAVQQQAETLFGELLSDSQRYFGLVAAGIVSGASDPSTLAVSAYHLSSADAAALFHNVNLKTSSTVHTDVSTGHLDTAPHGDAASAHVDTAAVHADTPSTHVDVASRHADVPATHVDTTTHVDAEAHADASFFGHHGDTHIPPHGDTSPHVDQTTTPHADTGTPHGDTNTAHIDQVTIPHGDTSTPHVDAAPHTDSTPHADDSVHIDT